MLEFFDFVPALFAQAADTVAEVGTGAPLPAEGAAPEGGGGGGGFPPMIFIAFGAMILLWLMLMGPQRKQEKKMKDMLGNLKKNDRVYTIGGVVGTVYLVDTEKNEVVLKVDDNTKMRFLKTAIAGVLTDNKAEDNKK